MGICYNNGTWDLALKVTFDLDRALLVAQAEGRPWTCDPFYIAEAEQVRSKIWKFPRIIQFRRIRPGFISTPTDFCLV